jgi:hypothetical protein
LEVKCGPLLQVAEQTAAAKREVDVAAATVPGLAFEDKVRLITALQPEPLAALVGVCYTLCSAAFEGTVLGVP